MSRRNQGTLVILDIGRNVCSEIKKESFFEKAKECTKRIIERKILSQDNNLVAILLLGSKITKNNMADECPGGFRHIQLLAPLQTPTWQMIKELPESPSQSRGDWFDAIIVAADHFKNGTCEQILHKKIILITNFKHSAKLDSFDVQQVIEGLKEDQFEIDIIGPDIYADNTKSEDIKIAKTFLEATNGATAPFDYTMRYLLFHKRKLTKPSPWNVDLSIGPNIKIPISAYIRIKDEPTVKKWCNAVKDPVTSTASCSEGIMKNKIHVNAENQAIVNPFNIIKGYHYGGQIIPFSECDKSMIYDSGEKCLSVYGYTDSKNIQWQNLNGDNLSYVFGRKGDKKAQKAVKCLVECLHELRLVGVVRRVYNKGNSPKMFVLMPVIDNNNFFCLSLVGICYKEEIKNMGFPATSLKKYACNSDQINAFKDLIKEMDLSKAYDDTFDDTEAFPIAETVNPSAQYVLDCIAYRAMNPGKPLPQPRDDIMSLFKVPPMIKERSKNALNKIQKQFSLNKVEVKNKTKNNQKLPDTSLIGIDVQNNENTFVNLPKVNIPIVEKQEINSVGTIDPINDFKILKEKGRSLLGLLEELIEVIEKLIWFNLDRVYTKALDTMELFRRECVQNDPSVYNNWMMKFKPELLKRKKENVSEMINERNLSFILKSENCLSKFETESIQDDSQLYENETQPNSKELTIGSEINNFFDEI